MFSLYTDFWKNIFNFNKKDSDAELGVSLIFNVIILAVLYFVGLLLAPPVMENTLVVVITFLVLIMAIRTLFELVRVFKK